MKIKEKPIRKVLIYLTILAILTLPFLMYRIGSNLQKQNSSVRWLWQNTGWNKTSKVEGEYTAFMYDVINAFSSDSTHSSMTKEMRIKYTAVNLKLATEFGYGYYDITILGGLESDLNPHAGDKEHILGEVGMFGQCYKTAKYYYFIGKDILPARLWRLVRFDFNKKSDLKDPINALKMTYIWLYIESYNHDGIEMNTISAYHWGGWLWKYWKYGMGEFPTKFIFFKGMKKYTRNPKAYYWTWKKMKTALENGRIDTAKTILNKWRKKGDKLKYEEIEYRRLYRVMKQKDRKLKEMEALNIIQAKQISDYKKIDKKEIRIAKQIGGFAKKDGWKEHWERLVKFCKNLVKSKLKKKSK